MKNQAINLPVFGIQIVLHGVGTDDVSGSIRSNLGPGFEQIEALLLAMACEGLPVASPAMYAAIETAVDAAANHHTIQGKNHATEMD